jgi:hypothetical protein
MPGSVAVDMLLETPPAKNMTTAFSTSCIGGGHIDAHGPFVGIFKVGARFRGLDVGLGADRAGSTFEGYAV